MDTSNITDELLEKVSAMSEAERKVFLSTLPNEISDQVSKLLAADKAIQQKDLLKPVSGTASELDAIEEIGPYKIISILGKGGMGTVFEAQQDKPIKRRVALKLINFGMDSDAVVSRFAAERQALALMNHPNIAQVFDGGTSAKGRPYFVMELVDGIQLDQYCDEKKLTTQQRLGLFQLICDAIQHAHQQGVIHRDLKPSNILVAESEGKPVPKVIDFGLAKALNADLTDRTIQTQLNQAMGTLQYMCPEQTELGSQQIDTRADIYSLGIVLYELLTGSPPLNSDTIKSMALDKVFSMIREKEFVRPSRQLQNSKLSHSISESRSTHSSRLINDLSGDLDWIVMKAIEKDRDRRYGSASEFGADVGRYLSNSVVLARPPSLRYSAGKFFTRNRGVVIAASLIASLLLISSVVSTVLFFKAERARKQAEQETTAKQDAIDKLDEAATVGMARLGDFAMQTGKTADAAVWYSAAAKNSLDQPRRRVANLMRLAGAAELITIPDAAIDTGLIPNEIEPDPTNQYVIVRDLQNVAEVWNIEGENRILTAKAADWIENGVVVAVENEIRLHEFPSLRVISSVNVPGALDISVSDDSKWISVCTGNVISIFEIGTEGLKQIHKFDVAATRSNFHPLASHLIAWSKSKTTLLQLQQNNDVAPDVQWSTITTHTDNTLNHSLRPRFIGNSLDVMMIDVSGVGLRIIDVDGNRVLMYPKPAESTVSFDVNGAPSSFSLTYSAVRFIPHCFALDSQGDWLALSIDNYGIRTVNEVGDSGNYFAAILDLKIKIGSDGKRRAELELVRLEKISNFSRDMSFNVDGSVLSGFVDGHARVTTHETSTDLPVHDFIRHQARLVSVASSTRNRVIFTAQEDGLIRRWVRGMREKKMEIADRIPWNAGYVSAKSPDGRYMIPVGPIGVGANHNVQVFNRDRTPASEPWYVGGWYSFADFEPETEKLWVAVASDLRFRINPGSIKLWDWKLLRFL